MRMQGTRNDEPRDPGTQHSDPQGPDTRRTQHSDPRGPDTQHSWAPRFTDDLVRPFVIATVVVITVVQLIMRPPAEFGVLTWTLTVFAGLTAIGTVLPWDRVGPRAQIVIVSVLAGLGAVLFAVSPTTGAVVFVFIASATAGERLASRQAAFGIAGAATALTLILTSIATVWRLVAHQEPWWLALTVGLTVYVGMARKDRSDVVAAAQLAAVQSERAAASEAREAALEERSRIAREIHDVLGHSLSGIAMQLDLADALHGQRREDEADEAVRRARALAVAGMAETRRAIHALREDTLPLPEAIAQLAESSGADYSTAGTPGPVPLPAAQAVIRSAQEAITNARRHAPGALVRILLEYDAARIRLTVTDSGGSASGPHPPDQGGGMGLVGMRERASLLHGTLYAGPSEGSDPGWTVRLEFPR